MKEMEPIEIRQSRSSHYRLAIFSAVAILFYFLNPFGYKQISYADSPVLTVILGIIFFGMLFYSVAELINNRPEIILTIDGIEIRNKGWKPWEYVNVILVKLETDIENGDNEYLILQLKNDEEIKCLISDLEKTRPEIMSLINLYRNFSVNPNVDIDQRNLTSDASRLTTD